ncbi:hypothetical protein [Deinococcus radiophilus]
MHKVHSPTFGTEVRWQAAHVPIPPELEVTLAQGHILLRNTASESLWLRGWTPAGRNAFRALNRTIDPGEDHRLIREIGQAGVRVWYSPPDSPEVRLLRADWTEHDQSRTLH